MFSSIIGSFFSENTTHVVKKKFFIRNLVITHNDFALFIRIMHNGYALSLNSNFSSLICRCGR